MIVDQLDACDAYRSLGERFAAGFDYLRGTDFTALPDGRYALRDAELVAIVQTYQTKPVEEGRWEAHRRHADIQYVFSGVERMGISPLARMAVQPPYDADKDVEFYLPGDPAPPRTRRGGPGVVTGDQAQFVRVDAGSFAIFLPQDVHMPNIEICGQATVKKVVIKVRLD